MLLGRVDAVRLPPLTHWLVQRQMHVHGGFQGRTNKLVDGCYSFWQGGAFPLLQAALAEKAELPAGGVASLFSTQGLLDYLLVCCQCQYGGLRDKPGKGRDYYHTCYGLSGLAVAAAEPPPPEGEAAPPAHWTEGTTTVNPVFNVSAAKAEQAMAWWAARPMPDDAE